MKLIFSFAGRFFLHSKWRSLYKQITYLHRTINLKITKWTIRIKKQKHTKSNLCNYWICYLFRLKTFQTSFKNSFQSKNNFQLSNFQFFTEYLWNKGQSKKKMEKNDENNCLIVFHSGQFLDVNVKTKGIVVYILEALWDLLRCWLKAENFKNKNCNFCKKFKLVKVV